MSISDAVSSDIPKCNLAICVPVFNDWNSVSVLLGQLYRATQQLHGACVVHSIQVVLVDDGSTDSLEPASLQANGVSVRVLHLTRNVGHQRAIAIGLAAIAQEIDCDAVVVMDGDGEDDPAHIPALLGELFRNDSHAVVFAQRSRRTEGLKFRLGYLCFRVLHWALTGKPCDVGNFSAIPAMRLKRLVCSSELWIHYAAAVACSRLPVAKVPCDRGRRYAGHSHMKVTSLVVHGLSAISVFSETVGVRICLALGIASGLTVVSLVTALYLRFMTTLAIPGWATSAVGLLLILMANLLLLTLNSVLMILGARNNVSFIPSRDWTAFVSDWTMIND